MSGLWKLLDELKLSPAQVVRFPQRGDSVQDEGEVVALNAGANHSAASSFFLPLDRIERALEKLRKGEPVTRGTLKTTFRSEPFDELRRLGLTDASERAVRKQFPEQTGMLTVAQLIPDSAASDVLAPGDILISVNGELVTEFVPLAAVLDDYVGRDIEIRVERGGRPVDATIRVDDLHAITPDEYLEFGDAIVNQLSYQQARHYNRPAKGVYVANPGYLLSRSGVPRGAVIVEVDGDPVETLDDFEWLNFQGYSVTIPHKQAVIAKAAHCDEPVRDSGAAIRLCDTDAESFAVLEPAADG